MPRPIDRSAGPPPREGQENLGPGEARYPELYAKAREMMGDYEDDPPAEPEVEEQPAEAPDEEPDEPQGAEIEDDGEEGARPAAGAAEVEKALKAAKLANLPESAIKSLSEEELLAWHAKHTKNESDVKAAFRENAELKRRLEEFEATKGSEPAVPTEPADQELLQLLTEEFGEERGRTFAAKLEQRDSQTKQQLEQATAYIERMLAERAFQRTVEEWRIGDDLPEGTFDKVLAQAADLSKTKGVWDEQRGEPRVRALIEAATKLVVPNIPSESERQRRAAIARARRKGTASAAQQRSAPEKPLTPRERILQTARKVVAGERSVERLRGD